jgi:hypothetical protein
MVNNQSPLNIHKEFKWRSYTKGIKPKIDNTPLPTDHRRKPWYTIRKHGLKSNTIGEFTLDLLSIKIEEARNKLLNTIDMFCLPRPIIKRLK